MGMLFMLVLLTTALAFVTPSATTSNEPRALDAFAATWSKIDAYSATLAMHETLGKDVQDRIYALTFKKPSDATIVIVKGPGRGGKVVWTGGDGVVGSPGGLLSGVKIHLAILDSRATSLRGDTVAMASFGWVLDHFRKTAGVKTESAGAPVDGAPTTEVALAVANPATNDGLTREVLLLSNATKLPVGVRRYVGTELVKEIHYSDVTVQGEPAPNPVMEPAPAATH